MGPDSTCNSLAAWHPRRSSRGAALDLVREAIRLTWESVRKAEAHFGRPFLLQRISFDLKGRDTGKLRIRGGHYEICFNRALLESSPDHLLKQTIPHEVSHLVAFQHYGLGINQHGAEWKAVMTDVFGKAPDRCHSLEVPISSAPFLYRCGCREFRFSARKHARMSSRAYGCKACARPVVFQRKLDAEPPLIHARRLLIYVGHGTLASDQLARVKKILSGAVVEAVTLQGGESCAQQKTIAKISKTLAVDRGAIRYREASCTIPSDCSHAVFFLEEPSHQQACALEELRRRGVKLRVLSLASVQSQ